MPTASSSKSVCRCGWCFASRTSTTSVGIAGTSGRRRRGKRARDMASGIRDRVAIIGMGCTEFGERWDSGAEDLMVEAFLEAQADAGIETKEIGAAWIGISTEELSIGKSGVTLSTALRLNEIPVTRVENLCASGTEALRGAVYA